MNRIRLPPFGSLKLSARKFYMRRSSPELTMDIGPAPYTGATHKQAAPR